MLTAGVDMPLTAIREQVSGAFDLIIQLARLVDGSRRVTHITEVLRMEGEVVTLQDLYVAKPPTSGEVEPEDEHGLLLGPLRCTGLKPHFHSKLNANGVELPTRLFQLEERVRPPAGADREKRAPMSRTRGAIVGLCVALVSLTAAGTAARRSRSRRSTSASTRPCA